MRERPAQSRRFAPRAQFPFNECPNGEISLSDRFDFLLLLRAEFSVSCRSSKATWPILVLRAQYDRLAESVLGERH